MRGWVPLVFLFIISVSATLASTTISGPNSFVGENGHIDTGYRSLEYTNASEIKYERVFIEIVSVRNYENNEKIEEYNVTWYYFQANIYQTEINVSKQNGIAITINEKGYRSTNVTSIVWRLIITANTTDQIEVTLKLTNEVSFVVRPSYVTVTPKPDMETLVLLLVPGFVLVLGIIIGFYLFLKRSALE